MEGDVATRRRTARVVGAVCVFMVCTAFVLLVYSPAATTPKVTSAPPGLSDLPSGCPPQTSVDALVQLRYPGATFNAAYDIGPGYCNPAPTVSLPDGEQIGVVIENGAIRSATVLRGGATSSLIAAFSRWSGYETYSQTSVDVFGLPLGVQNQQVVVASAERTVPSLQVPSVVSKENESGRALCCALSAWVGQTDSPGGLADQKLIQIGVEMTDGQLSRVSPRYVGFYEALPSAAVYFNSTQVPCGMPARGGAYKASAVNLGAYNSTHWQYALTFANDACHGARYVVYAYYPMNGQYGEVQTEAPVMCVAGLVAKQAQLPQFSGDKTRSTSFTFNAAGTPKTSPLALTSSTGYVIELTNHGSDTYNSAPSTSGGFSTYWVSSQAPTAVQIC